jgi:hypothetical protein
VKGFRDLKVWEKAHQLTLQVYKATASFPKEEMFGLTSQIRRAAASIPANIAEGCGRSGDAELGRFLQIAMGSASELEYHPSGRGAPVDAPLPHGRGSVSHFHALCCRPRRHGELP